MRVDGGKELMSVKIQGKRKKSKEGESREKAFIKKRVRRRDGRNQHSLSVVYRF